MLDWSAILARMPVEYNAVPEPDDFDQQLRDLTSGQAEPAKFTELSAAERARRASSPPPPQPGKLRWRSARKAKQLRKPLTPPGSKPPPRSAGGPRRMSSPGARRPASSKRQRLIKASKTVAILVAFAALLFVLHLAGFGPQ
jgi:hypothetical protein